jgi:hypothetical protein
MAIGGVANPGVHSVIDWAASKGLVLGVWGVAKPIRFATPMSLNPLAGDGILGSFLPVLPLPARFGGGPRYLSAFFDKKGNSRAPFFKNSFRSRIRNVRRRRSWSLRCRSRA